MIRIRNFFRSSVFSALLLSPMPLLGAFIDPADMTGSLGHDPDTWAVSFPEMNSNSVQPLHGITATVRTTTPWTRGAANTTYQAWDRFTSGLAANNPNSPSALNEVDAAPFNPNGSATVTQTIPGAFLTSSGNIYSPTSATAFSVAIPNYNLGSGYQTNFLVQLRAFTGDFNVSSFQINGTPVSSLPNFSWQLVYSAMGGDTAALDYKLEFSLLGNSALDTLTFNSAGSGLSFDKVFIDTTATAIPEPSIALLSCLLIPLYLAMHSLKSRD
jgi:hypothetical protein